MKFKLTDSSCFAFIARRCNIPFQLHLSTAVFCSLFLWFGWLTTSSCKAQETIASVESVLSATQHELADQLVKLESLLLRSADLESVDNPTRAALLQQAVAVSKQAQLVDTLLKAARNLTAGQLSEAVENQKASRDTLKRLLELLQSENREQRVRQQRDQVRRWIEETDRLL